MRSGDRYLVKSKLQPSTKCELSEAKLRLASCAGVDYGEQGDFDNKDFINSSSGLYFKFDEMQGKEKEKLDQILPEFSRLVNNLKKD